MTCIVGIADGKSVWIGGDTCYSDKDSRGQIAHPKIFYNTLSTWDYEAEKERTEKMLFGCCGFFRMFQLLEYGFIIPSFFNGTVERWLTLDFAKALREFFKEHGFAKNKDGVDTFPEGAFLLGFRGKLYHIEDNFQFIESAHQEDACGSGSKFALGSLYTSRSMSWTPEMRIRMALASACVNPFVAAPFDIWEIKNGD